jgi:hypothetical protein
MEIIVMQNAMKRIKLSCGLVIGTILFASVSGCGTHANASTPEEKQMVKLIEDEAALYKTSGKDICMNIAKRMHIYADNGLYSDAGFQQTYQSYLDIGVKEGCMKNGQASPVAQQAPVSPHVKVGGFLCDNPMQVIGEAQLRGRSPMVFRGCMQVGADVAVNVMSKDSNTGSIQVGNSGGTAWVDPQDLVQ